MNGLDLLICGDYPQAIERLRLDSARDHGDDFHIGPSLQLGVAYLCAERFVEAQDQFEKLIADTKYTVSLHAIYAGLVEWFQGRSAKAVDLWTGATNCQYASERGMDVSLLLFYASVREPLVCDVNDARRRIKNKLGDLDPEELFAQIAQFILGNVDESTLVAAARSVDGRNRRARIARRLAQVEFYLALVGEFTKTDADPTRYLHNCAKARGLKDLIPEYVIARWEILSKQSLE